MDLTGIEPANLCNANAALSQLSYRPITLVYYKRFEEKSQEKKSPSNAFRRAFPVRFFSGRLR